MDTLPPPAQAALASHPKPRAGSLRSGAEFRESLRDGRRVVANGSDVADVTAEPVLRRGIDTIAAYFDAQHDPAVQDEITSLDPATGERFSTAWLVPRSRGDLRAYDSMIRFSTRHTLGVFGRPPDYGPVKAISFVAWNHLISRREPESQERILRFLAEGRRNNLTSADVIVDVQSDRKLPAGHAPGRLRVVEERRDGLVVSGAKAGNSAFAQGNIGTISMPPPRGGLPEECMIWAAIPANAPGLTLLLREALTTGTESAEDHPLDSAGEEMDALLIFDRVLIPWDYVFSYRNLVTAELYTTLGQFAFWKICTRLSYRAEIFAGAAQMIVDALGTDHIPAVRAMVADVLQYAEILRGMVTAAMERAAPTESGVVLPDHQMVTAARLYAIDSYPRIMQTLRELSGQGLISRLPRATWERVDLGPLLDEYLPGHAMDASTKNRLFNFVWDLTCGPHAMRVALFENINATPAPALREELYRTSDRGPAMSLIKARLGLA